MRTTKGRFILVLYVIELLIFTILSAASFTSKAKENTNIIVEKQEEIISETNMITSIENNTSSIPKYSQIINVVHTPSDAELLYKKMYILEERKQYPSDIVDISNHIYSFEEMEEDINLLNKKYPEYFLYEILGYSADNKPIYQLIIGNPDASNAIYIQSALHAREWMNTWILMEALEYYFDNWENLYEGIKTYGSIFENYCIYLLPMVNPDGVSISQFGFDSIQNDDLREACKKMPGANNPKRWKANARGVDLNRQFDVDWNRRMDTNTPSSEFFNGYEAESEPEIHIIKKALDQRTFTAAITYHSMEGALYWDLHQEGTLRDKNKELVEFIAKETGYKIGAASITRGLDYNYMVFKKEIPSVVIETGRVQCPLPYSQWKTIWKENYMLMINLANLYNPSK